MRYKVIPRPAMARRLIGLDYPEALRPWVTGEPNEQGWQRGDCPLHDDGTGDASYNFDEGVWTCYVGCDSGSIHRLVRRIVADDRPTPETRKLRAAKETEPLPTDAAIDGWHEALLGPRGEEARAYLENKRGISPETMKRFRIGWDSSRLTFPVRDASGALVNVRRRRLGAGQKMLGLTGHTAKLAYPLPEFLSEAEDRPDAPVVTCEGELDALLLWEQGFLALTSVAGAGSLGSVVAEVAEQYPEAFAGRTVVVWTDHDEAGWKARDAVMRAVEPLAGAVVPIELEAEPEGQDVTDLWKGWGRDFAERVEAIIARGEAEADEEYEPSSWSPVALSAYITGDVSADPPTILRRQDGECLLYERKLQSVVGESESAKTWLALIACLELLRQERHVLFLDFEDDPSAIASRLVALGVEPETADTYFHYVRPEDPLNTPESERAFLSLLDSVPVELTIIDGITEVMALHGWGYDNIEFAHFVRLLPRRLMSAGSGVLLLDHLPLSNRGRKEAIGGQHKRAALTGTGLRIDMKTPFGRGMEGRFEIQVTKDKGGGFVRALHRERDDKLVAYMHLFSDADSGRVTYSLEPPPRKAVPGTGQRVPMTSGVSEEDAAPYYAALTKYLRKNGPTTRNTLAGAGLLKGNNQKRYDLLAAAAADDECDVQVRGSGGNKDPLTYYVPEAGE